MAHRRVGVSREGYFGHADRAVEADHLAVQHLVLDDVDGEGGELVRAAEALRERDLAAELVARLLWQRGQQRSVERARRDRHDADPARG